MHKARRRRWSVVEKVRVHFFSGQTLDSDRQHDQIVHVECGSSELMAAKGSSLIGKRALMLDADDAPVRMLIAGFGTSLTLRCCSRRASSHTKLCPGDACMTNTISRHPVLPLLLLASTTEQ